MNTGGVLRVSADLTNLAEIRAYVEERVAALGASAEVMADMVLAVDEAATNLIAHGYRGGPGTIEVEVRGEVAQVAVYMRDTAPPYDPTGAPPPDLTSPLEERQPGGLGIYLIRQFTDEMSYGMTPQGQNELVLKRKLALRGG
jgi:serine/threonine-protein kinase RsbW